MGKDREKDKAKEKSRKTKDGDKKLAKEKDKKTGKEKTKTADKKNEKPKPKSGKSDKPKAPPSVSKTPKSKAKSNKEKAKPAPKSKLPDTKFGGKKSTNPKSAVKSKPHKGAPTTSKAQPASTKPNKPKSDVPKLKKKAPEKSRMEEVESALSAAYSEYDTGEEEESVAIVIKEMKKTKGNTGKKRDIPLAKPKMPKVAESSLSDPESEEFPPKVAAKNTGKEKAVPPKKKEFKTKEQQVAKKSDKTKSGPKKKAPSPPKKSKEKDKKSAQPASTSPAKSPVHQATKKTAKPHSKVRSESEESPQKDESDTDEGDDHQYDPDQTTSVDHHTAEVEAKAEESTTEQDEGAGNEEAEATTGAAEEGEQPLEGEIEYAVYEEAPEEPTEFTKPTVNNPKGRKETTPMCYSPVIGTTEFEALYDEVKRIDIGYTWCHSDSNFTFHQITELNTGATTLKYSYGSIVTSLVHLHNKRMKAKLPKDQKKLPHQQQINFMTTRSEVSVKTAAQMEDCLESIDKYDMERFINPVTREDTFKMLFEEVGDPRMRSPEQFANNVSTHWK